MKYLKKFENWVTPKNKWTEDEYGREYDDELEGEDGGELIHPLTEDGYLTGVNYLSLDEDGRIDEIGFKGEEIRELSEDDGPKAYKLNQENKYQNWEFTKVSGWKRKK